VASVRILVVEDHEQFRRFIYSTLEKAPELLVVEIASDGLAAVQKAEELQPDLIVLDIGLPSLNGIEAARRIRKLSPESKILFVSQESSVDVVREALGTGASGYIVKTDAGRELLKGVSAVLRGELFVGARFSGHDFVRDSNVVTAQEFRSESAVAPLQRSTEIARRHEVVFYSDDAGLLDDLTQFIGAALKAGNAAVVVAAESHRDGLLLRLQAHGLDIRAAIEQGRFISTDVADALSAFIINEAPDASRFLGLFNNLIATAADATKREHASVAVFGEGVHLLWEQGNAEAAIRVERLTNQIAPEYDAHILCGYHVSTLHGGMDSHIFQRICAEHSAVYSR
jgi:DNA-binding NarL/FixJ family response regulator